MMEHEFWVEKHYTNIFITIERLTHDFHIKNTGQSIVVVHEGEYVCRTMWGFVWKESFLSSRKYPYLSQCSTNIFVAETYVRTFEAKKPFLIQKNREHLFNGLVGDTIVIFASSVGLVVKGVLNEDSFFNKLHSFTPICICPEEGVKLDFLF